MNPVIVLSILKIVGKYVYREFLFSILLFLGKKFFSYTRNKIYEKNKVIIILIEKETFNFSYYNNNYNTVYEKYDFASVYKNKKEAKKDVSFLYSKKKDASKYIILAVSIEEYDRIALNKAKGRLTYDFLYQYSK